MSSSPASVHAVLEAVARLQPRDPLAAAAHLLSPGADPLDRVSVYEGEVMWRGVTEKLPGKSLMEQVKKMRLLVARMQEPTDVFLDLSAAPAQLVVAQHFGAHVIVTGGEQLFGTQTVFVDFDLPDEVVEAVRELAAGPGLATGQVLLGGVSYRVRATGRRARVSRV